MFRQGFKNYVLKCSIEDVLLHKLIESLLVSDWLYTGQEATILTKHSGLNEPLRLLVEIPLLQVVYDAEVYDA